MKGFPLCLFFSTHFIIDDIFVTSKKFMIFKKVVTFYWPTLLYMVLWEKKTPEDG